ncbi:MAG TPA: hypothetical protein VM425_22280 [Myxococcota bacterium]|nr:hypothetical protein [Myxococcota bacterium]
MANDKFRVEPLRQYRQARYPSAWARQPAVEEEDEKKLNPAMLMVVFILALGLVLGVIGCLADYKAKSCGPGLVMDTNGNCVGPDPNDCNPGDLVCDQNILMACNQDGLSWSSQECDDYCMQMYGFGSYSKGCDALAEDPCQCEYDITEGIWVECTPGEFQCVDDDTASVCSADYMGWENVDCVEYCTDNFGDDYYSTGCKQDNPEENICGCEYGMVDGEPAP